MNPFLYYLLQISPALAVLVFMLVMMDRRLTCLEKVVSDLLDQCWDHVLMDHEAGNGDK